MRKIKKRLDDESSQLDQELEKINRKLDLIRGVKTVNQKSKKEESFPISQNIDYNREEDIGKSRYAAEHKLTLDKKDKDKTKIKNDDSLNGRDLARHEYNRVQKTKSFTSSAEKRKQVLGAKTVSSKKVKIIKKVFSPVKKEYNLGDKKSIAKPALTSLSPVEKRGLLPKKEAQRSTKEKIESEKNEKTKSSFPNYFDLDEKSTPDVSKTKKADQESISHKRSKFDLVEKTQDREDGVSDESSVGEKLLNVKITETKVITTTFDSIIDLVEKQGRVLLSEISKNFNVNKNIAQQWGEILSENKLIDYHIPTFGEPEFRKLGIVVKKGEKLKKSKDTTKKIKLTKKKLLLIEAIIVALGVIGLVTLFLLAQKPVAVQVDNITDVEGLVQENKEIQDNAQDVLVAFSGNGTYDCRNLENTIRYAIIDKSIKIEKLDGSSKVVVKDNKLFTLNINTGAWVESALKEGLPLPGSGIYPKTVLKCQQITIEASEFDT